MPNEQTYLPKIGVDMAFWAKVASDVAPDGTNPGSTTYETSKRLPGLVNVAFAANSQTGIYPADNGPYASAAQLGDLGLQVQCADLPPVERAAWYGQKYDTATGLLQESQINPIDMAFGYRVQKSNNAYRYIWFYKVKPGMADETAATKSNSIAFQDGTTPMTATMRMSDGTFRRILDDDDPSLPEGVTAAVIAANFFTDPNWAVAVTTP